MGGHLCCPVRNDYCVNRRRQEKHGIGPKISTVTPACQKFDSLNTASTKSGSAFFKPPAAATGAAAAVSASTAVSYDPSIIRDKLPLDPEARSFKNQISVTNNGTILVSAASNNSESLRISQFSQASAIPGFGDHDCDTISDVSSHSDLGSDCTTSAQNTSSRSATLKSDTDTNCGSPRGLEGDGLGDDFNPWGGDAETEEARDVVGTINSRDSVEEEYFRTHSHAPKRQYTYSRLGNRNNTKSRLYHKAVSEEVIQWKKGNKLGSGTFGTVFLGLTNHGGLIAVKEITVTSDLVDYEKEYEKIYKEVSILQTLDHVNIVSYFGSNYEETTISIFMQYVPGGSLCSIIQKFGPLEETITICYTKQLLSAITYLHENNVVHRDIKSANIMLMPEGQIKLIDFGCATRLCMRLSQSGSHLQKSLRGTPYWMAPEVINETGHGKKSDVWSAGCTVFEMLTGKPPWGDREPFAAIYAIGSDDVPLPTLPEDFSLHAREFVRLALLRDQRKRPHANKLKSHPFLIRPLPPRSPKLEAEAFKYSKRKKPRRKETF